MATTTSTVKKPKLPKAPKANASAETLKRYLQKLSDLEKQYKAKLKEANKKTADVKKAEATRKKLQKAVASKREAFKKL